MTARRPLLKEDDKGVSAVLGAVLMFGLFVATLAMVQVQFVPVWAKEKEAALATNLANELAQINADMGRQVGNASAAAMTDPLTLGSEGFSFFSQAAQPATVQFAPTAGGLSIASNQITIQEQQGVDLSVLGEEWRTVGATTSVTSVQDIEHLRIRIVSDTGEKKPFSRGDYVNLEITDADGAYAGAYRGYIHNAKDDLLVRITKADRTDIYDQPFISDIITKDFDAVWLDTLDVSIPFEPILTAAKAPYSLTLTSFFAKALPAAVHADFSIVYDQVVGGTTQRVGGQGVVIPNYVRAGPGGALSVALPNQQLPEQTYTLEYGALLLDQPDGSAMVVPPTFDVVAGVTQVRIAWSLPGLGGQANSISGSDKASVTLAPAGSSLSLGALAPRLTFAIATTHPGLWASFWDGKLAMAGLSGNVTAQGAPCSTALHHYTICTTATTATLNIYGPTRDPASTANDLFLSYRVTDVNVHLKSSG
jgi:hypothetical protein